MLEKDKYYKISLKFGNFKNNKVIEKEIRSVVTRGKGLGEGKLSEGGQMILTSNYK